MDKYTFGTFYSHHTEKWSFQLFKGGIDTGKSIAALKLLLVISANVNFYTGQLKISITELENLTGLSRPMVINGLNFLNNNDLIEIDKSSYINEYKIKKTKIKPKKKGSFSSLKKGY